MNVGRYFVPWTNVITSNFRVSHSAYRGDNCCCNHNDNILSTLVAFAAAVFYLQVFMGAGRRRRRKREATENHIIQEIFKGAH